LSYEYISSRLKEIAPDLHAGKTIVCHFGAGASLAALVGGKGFTTTMGFTPLDGLIMGTRTGTIDPGVLLYLMNEKKYTLKDLEDMLYYKSGVLGLSEESSDFYAIEISKLEKSQEAWKICVYNLIKQIGSLVAAMDGFDGIVFTAGVGENAALLRTQVIAGLSFFGLEIDESLNKSKAELISTASSKVKVMVIPTEEELMIAKHALALQK